MENLKKAGLLLAISAHTKNEAIDLLDMPRDRVVNILAACDERFCPMEKTDLMDLERPLRSLYRIKDKFIMYAPSGYDNRKNLERLIQSFAMLPGDLRGTHQLVLVGKAGQAEQKQIRLWACKAGLDKNEVVMTGYVTDNDLVALYNLSTLFIFPSWHAGLGLPVLEARSCGAPAIGSDRTSIPEVIGRKDALFNPFDPKAIAGKMAEVLINKDFCQSLRKHSLKQAGKFSWDESARLSIETFEELHQRNTSRCANDSPPQEEQYKKLINALAGLSKKTIAPTDHDLAATANSIEKNRQQNILQTS